jgi:hypothetical protein
MPESSADSFYLKEKNQYQVHKRVEAFFLLIYDPTVAKARERNGSEKCCSEKQHDYSGYDPR